MYCTYLTIYRGNKLPPFYIGSSSIRRIESGYKGSVSSKKYKSIWKSELSSNPHLFKVMVISRHFSREDALLKEEFLQKSLNIVQNPLYINCSIAKKNGFFGMDVSGENNPMYGKSHPNKGKKYSDEYKNNLSSAIKKTWTDERKRKQSNRLKGENNPMYGSEWDIERKIEKSINMKGDNNPMYGKSHSEETRKKMAEKARGRKVSNETRKKLSIAGKGRVLSEEAKIKLSEDRKNKKFSKEHKENLSKSKKEAAEIKICCLYCHKITSLAPWKRFHGANCKLNNSSEPILFFKSNN